MLLLDYYPIFGGIEKYLYTLRDRVNLLLYLGAGYNPDELFNIF